jgi:hypothetical protein
MKFSVVMSAAALAVAGNAMANTATTSVAAPSKSITDNLVVRYYGELSGGAVSNPFSGTVPEIDGSKAANLNLFNQLSLGYKNGDYRAVVVPRFTYGISDGDSFTWDNLRITLSKANIASAGAYSLKSIALVNMFGTTQGSIDAGMVYRPRIALSHEISMGAGSRWSLDSTTYVDTRLYNSAAKISDSRTYMNMYASLGLGYQINPTIGAAFTFEAHGRINKIKGQDKLDYNPSALYSDNGPGTAFRVAAPMSFAGGKLGVAPFLQMFPLTEITANNSYLGLELTGTLY